MTFTKNIVLETLNQYRGSQYLTGSDRTYRWVAMLPDNAEEMEPDILYVCFLSEAIKRNSDVPGYHYLCIRDRYTDDIDDEDKLCGVIINENKDLSWLSNIVQKRFLQISEWVTKMQNALIENCGYQRLIDLCEPILTNSVLVFDSSYSLLAYTRNFPCKERVNAALLERGYHTDETLQELRELGRFEIYEREQGVIISAPGAIIPYELVSKWCRYGSELLLHVVMECSHTPLSLAAVDLFEVFMGYIEICFQRQQRTNPSHVYSSLLHEMLYGELNSPFIIGERAKTSDIPFSGYFNAYHFVFKDNSTVIVGRFVQELMTYLPKSKIVAHKYEVVALNAFDSSSIQKQSALYLAGLTPLLDKYSAVCGVSEVFTSLPELKNAYIQATRAQTIGVQLRTLGNIWDFNREMLMATAIERSGNVFYYNDVYIHLALHFAQSGTFNAFNNTFHNNALKKLIEYDRENNTRLVQILYAHLASERRATASGKLLRMHRNNVLYHISRIEEITGINLDDYWARLKLMLAFHFFEMIESNRLYISPPDASSELAYSEITDKIKDGQCIG